VAGVVGMAGAVGPAAQERMGGMRGFGGREAVMAAVDDRRDLVRLRQGKRRGGAMRDPTTKRRSGSGTGTGKESGDGCGGGAVPGNGRGREHGRGREIVIGRAKIAGTRKVSFRRAESRRAESLVEFVRCGLV